MCVMIHWYSLLCLSRFFVFFGRWLLRLVDLSQHVGDFAPPPTRHTLVRPLMDRSTLTHGAYASVVASLFFGGTIPLGYQAVIYLSYGVLDATACVGPAFLTTRHRLATRLVDLP